MAARLLGDPPVLQVADPVEPLTLEKPKKLVMNDRVSR
jgi:hypothetical protein